MSCIRDIVKLTIDDALVMLMLSPGRLSVSAVKFVIIRDQLNYMKRETHLLFHSHLL